MNKRDDARVPFQLHKTVVLVGMMGAGKTAVGTALARQLSVPFRDSDHALEAAANRTIAEIFSRDGETFFRARETQVIGRLLQDDPAILSTGGGAFMSESNRQMISQRGVSVWLSADLKLLWSRVRHKDSRPLLRTADPLGTLSELFEARVPIYEQADLKVQSAAGFTIEDMVDRVIAALLERPDVLTGP
ncbi:shikimate kinase [Oceaniovalibus sp. ACAM 378]|uniref:shikimate kinase n=1 Tax=Oceaniovalibus sp. ACAM 378 TaxID=2599923 RepID=UPI0011D68AA7|nr:shikimate kinase [Oceaniovalibus sp. ACAM 378]TYB89816.1 shikimate kinase [Oceaniovalibus sp. ACAM 378]